MSPPGISPHRMPLALRVASIAVWVAFMVGMANWSNTEAATAGAVAGTVALGALVGRWWVLIAPLVSGVLLALATLLATPDDAYEDAPGMWALYFVFLAGAIAALLAIGVWLNRSAGRLRARR
jgi:hypothetical protein